MSDNDAIMMYMLGELASELEYDISNLTTWNAVLRNVIDMILETNKEYYALFC